jgi:hypothetical protein
MNVVRVGGACGPPPPFVAPLVPRCALTSGATPRDVLSRRLRLGPPPSAGAAAFGWGRRLRLGLPPSAGAASFGWQKVTLVQQSDGARKVDVRGRE